MKNILVFVLILLFVNLVVAQEESTSAPAVKTFATDPDNIGALANSVNLFSGNVALPLNLISLSGVNVAISYSSAGVDKSVGTWNLEAPTGILGLGWSMGYPQIIVDNKQTGARDDDEFYLVEGGSSNKLIRTGTDAVTTAKVYETKNYQFWRIHYYPTSEKWEITKEDGTKYIYGDTGSGRSTVQYLIKWGNWIGSSSLIANQQNQVIAWNISEVVDTWGSNVTYEYENIEQHVGYGTYHGDNTHTEASYLKKIKDIYGRVAELFYGDKDPNEYMEPHTEFDEHTIPNTADAYQERYEKKFLDHIDVYTKDDYLLNSVYFEYDETKFFEPNTNREKRLLTSITHKNSLGVGLPSINFSYKESSPQGVLETVTTPTGGTIKYYYEELTIGHSDRSLTLTAPTGYSNPTVWNGDDVVVVTWRNGDYITIYAYEWDGEWVGGKVTTSDVYAPKDGDNQNIAVSFQRDFFAVLHTRRYDDSDDKTHVQKLFVFPKREGKRGEWEEIYKLIKFNARYDGEPIYTGTQLVTGSKFVAIKKNGENSQILGFINDNGLWIEKTFYTYSFVDSQIPEYLYIGGTNNYLWIHNRAPNTDGDLVNFQYMDEENIWHDNKTFYTAMNFYPKGYWYANNSSMIGLGSHASTPAAYIWNWDENYNNFEKTIVGGLLATSSNVFSVDPLVSIITPDNNYSKLLRYDGNSWIIYSTGSSANKNYSTGNDFVIQTDHPTYKYRTSFNPNSRSWNGEDLDGTNTPFLSIAGINYSLDWMSYDTSPIVYRYRFTDGSWSESDINLVSSGDIQKVLTGAKYFTYQKCFAVPYPNNAVVHFIKNGSVISTKEEINGEGFWDGTNFLKPILVSANTIVTFDSHYLEDASELKLRRVIGESASGNQAHYVVQHIEIDDKFETKYTAFDYNVQSSSIDPSGNIAKFNMVRTRPGTNNPLDSYHPYGYTDTYFFNGLDPVNFTKPIPIDASKTNAIENYQLLTGNIYLTEIFDEVGSRKSINENFWYVSSKNINAELGYYSRIKMNRVSQGVINETNFTYNSENGLLDSKKFNLYEGNSEISTIEESFKYGYEKYSELEDLHILSPIIETKSTNYKDSELPFDMVYKISATTWTNSIGGKWAPYKTFISKVEKYVGDSFTEWGGSTPSSDWLKTSEVISRDSKGNVLEAIDVEGLHSVTKYGFDSSVPIASITNSTNSESLVELCQEYNTIAEGDLAVNLYKQVSIGNVTYSMFDEPIRGKVQKVITNNEVAGVMINMDELDDNRNYIIEFDIKVSLGEVQLQINSGAGTYIVESMNSTIWEHKRFKWVLSNEASWSRIFIVSNYNSSSTSATFYLDNIRIYPVDAFVSSTNYDPIFFTPVCATNSQGVNSYVEYDTYQRPIRARNDDLAILSETSYYNSRENNGDVFNTSNPNYTRSVTLDGESRTYSDGFGKTLQTQAKVSDTEIMVSESLYDELGRGYIQTKPTKITAGFGYRTGFITSLASDGKMYGEVQTYNNDYYPYSETVFEKSPLSRAIESGAPGTDYRIGGGHTSTVSYSANSLNTEEFSGYTSRDRESVV